MSPCCCHIRWSFPCTAVRGDLVRPSEDLEGRVSLNTIVLAQITLLCAIHLHQWNVLLLQCRRSLLILGRKSLAVSAPWCKDYVDTLVMYFWRRLEPGRRLNVNLHSARTRSFSWMNASKVSFLRSWTSLAAAIAAKSAPAIAAVRIVNV